MSTRGRGADAKPVKRPGCSLWDTILLSRKRGAILIQMLCIGVSSPFLLFITPISIYKNCYCIPYSALFSPVTNMDTRTQPNQTNASVVANALPQPQVPYDNVNVTPARLPRTPPGFEGMISGHGLRIRFCVWMPDLPRQDNPVTHRDARPRLGSGFDTEAHGIDLLGHARQFGLGWREFQDYAVRLFRTQHPAAGLQIQAVRDGGTGSIRWQGMIHHHPRYGIYSNAIIDSESSWRAFALAIGHAATVGQDSQIWCVAGGEPEPHAVSPAGQNASIPSSVCLTYYAFHNFHSHWILLPNAKIVLKCIGALPQKLRSCTHIIRPKR
jgi:hypothetical protein